MSRKPESEPYRCHSGTGKSYAVSMPCLSGPEAFIKPLVKSVRSEFKVPVNSFYAKVKEDIVHQFATLNRPVSLDILPVTAVHVAPVLPPVAVGSLGDFGRRLGLAEISAQERTEARLRRSKNTEIPMRKSESVHTPQLAVSEPAPLSPLPESLQLRTGNFREKLLEISPRRPPARAKAPALGGQRRGSGGALVRKFSPEIPKTPEILRRSVENSAKVEITANGNFGDISPGRATPGRTKKETAPGFEPASTGVRVTLDVAMEGGAIGNLLEIEELLSDAEQLLRGERITQEEISRELRLLEEISDHHPEGLRNSWSDIEAELDRLRQELGTNSVPGN